MMSERERLKRYRTLAKWCERNSYEEARLQLPSGEVITWKSRTRSLK